MIRLPFLQVLGCLFCVFSYANTLLAEETFLLINGMSNENIMELGSHIHERITPCSTFKIALSLIGFNEGILQDEVTPTWSFQEGYDDFLKSWKLPQTPQSWMKTSCVWYSKVLATQLGQETVQKYLSLFKYGNQDLAGGLTKAWLSSSLKISPKEQVDFLQKMVQNTLPISNSAMQKTRDLLFVEELSEGWKLFGKTGWSGSILGQDGKNIEFGWFVGWIEKDADLFLFAYNICEDKIDLSQRIPRVKQLLKDANFYSN